MHSAAAEKAFLKWWTASHDWDFTGDGLYETHAKKCFMAGWASKESHDA
jgi:hypothetical protein